MQTPDFRHPDGEPAYLDPSSIQWRIYKNPIAMGIGGVAAVLMEFADPRIRSGVWDHSTYPKDPIGRSRRTGQAALVGCYGPRSEADRVIGRVNRMHAAVRGETPGGRAYTALDPDLLAWVSATAEYGFLKAYHHYVAPLTDEEQARYWREGEAVTRLYGVQDKPYSEHDFLRMMEELAGGFEPHAINLEFLAIIRGGRAAPGVPRPLHRALAHGAVAILPPAVREALELGPSWDLSWTQRWMLKLAGALADRRAPADAPHRQACERLGLPADFLYLSQDRQRALLAARPDHAFQS